VPVKGTIEIGYAVVESHWNRGYATAAVEALVSKAREAPEVRCIVAHSPLERPQSGRVLEKARFARVREMEDADEAGNAVRVEEWQLAGTLVICSTRSTACLLLIWTMPRTRSSAVSSRSGCGPNP
jgi:hypothetical protein